MLNMLCLDAEFRLEGIHICMQMPRKSGFLGNEKFQFFFFIFFVRLKKML